MPCLIIQDRASMCNPVSHMELQQVLMHISLIHRCIAIHEVVPQKPLQNASHTSWLKCSPTATTVGNEVVHANTITAIKMLTLKKEKQNPNPSYYNEHHREALYH